MSKYRYILYIYTCSYFDRMVIKSYELKQKTASDVWLRWTADHFYLKTVASCKLLLCDYSIQFFDKIFIND